jgi:S1-C subfamily serine protease
MIPWAAHGEDAGDAAIRKSVVKITAIENPLDAFRPWSKGHAQEATGSGVIIAGHRILTNAHVVNHSSQIFVQPDKSTDKIEASVLAIAPGIDLAVLKLEDETFFDAHPPLRSSSQLPAVQQTVFVYGYPEGGTELSVTRGIVSRLEYADYYLGVEGLRIQVDAAINPGNSGGPVVAGGQMIGIVFSKLERADNIGYIIPVEEIDLFFEDLKDGRYDGKRVLPVKVQRLENPGLRARLGLDKKARGVIVRKVETRDPSFLLREGDILCEIAGKALDNAGMIQSDGGQLISFRSLVQLGARDGRLPIQVLRGAKPLALDVPVTIDDDHLFRFSTDPTLPYFIFGPLVFSEASEPYVSYMLTPSGPHEVDTPRRMVYTMNPLYTRYGDRPAFPGERIVIVTSPMFSHRISKGYDDPYAESVAETNGVRVKNLAHLVEILRDSTDEFVEFKFNGHFTDKIVFRRKEAIAATEEVLTDNGIRQHASPDMAKIWNGGRAR